MKKFLLSAFVITSFLGFAVVQHLKSGSDDANILISSPAPSVIPTSSASPQANAAFKDGTYIGDSVDAFYGNVQVKAVIQGGKLVDVQFLNFPQDRETSSRISAQSLPILRTEAIAAQSANVDVVTGATQTSHGFQQSLQSALQKAKV